MAERMPEEHGVGSSILPPGKKNKIRGRLAQWQSDSFTPSRPEVQSLQRPKLAFYAGPR